MRDCFKEDGYKKKTRKAVPVHKGLGNKDFYLAKEYNLVYKRAMITIEASRPFRTTLTTFLDDAVAAGHMRVEEVGERKEYYPTSDLRRMFAYVTPGMVTITRESAMGDVSIELDQRKTLAWVSMRRTTYGTKETFKEIYDQSAMIETEKMLVGYRRRHNIPTGR